MFYTLWIFIVGVFIGVFTYKLANSGSKYFPLMLSALILAFCVVAYVDFCSFVLSRQQKSIQVESSR